MASEHCLLINFLASCKQREGGTDGSSMSMAFVSISWNTFKVYILQAAALDAGVGQGDSCATDAS